MMKGHTFVTGEPPAFADVTISPRYLFLRIFLGKDIPEWKDLLIWHGNVDMNVRAHGYLWTAPRSSNYTEVMEDTTQ